VLRKKNKNKQRKDQRELSVIIKLHLVMRRRSRWLGEPRRRRTDGLRDWDELQLPEQWLWLCPLLMDLQSYRATGFRHPGMYPKNPVGLFLGTPT